MEVSDSEWIWCVFLVSLICIFWEATKKRNRSPGIKLGFRVVQDCGLRELRIGGSNMVRKPLFSFYLQTNFETLLVSIYKTIWLFICYFCECLVKGKWTSEDLAKSWLHVCLLLGCFMLFLKVVNLLGDTKACSANFGYPMFSKFPTVSFGTTPQPTNSDHQDYEPFLVGNFNKPSFVTIASWVGGRPKVS